MKIGIYYPTGHSTFERAVAFFKENLGKVAGDDPYIRFTIRDDHLYLQDIQLDTKYFFVNEFKDTLASMAIQYLDIDRDILPGEIQKFIRSLIVYRAKFRSTKTFIQIQLEDLPQTVRIAQAEYLSSEIQHDDGAAQTDSTQQTMEVFLESLSGHGLDSKQLDQCRHLLEGITLNPKLTNRESAQAPLITWSDVERLILNLVEGDKENNKEDAAKSQQSLNALASILTTFGESASDESTMEAIDLLVSLVKKNSTSTVEKDDDGKITPRKNENNDLSVNEIDQFVSNNGTPYVVEKYLTRTHRSEILTIALRLLQQDPPLQVKYRLQLILREILTGPVQEIEWETIASGIHDLLHSQNKEQLSVIMMMIINPLRRSEFSSPLYLLEQVSRYCNAAELNRLLPYIMNELLVRGKQEDYEVFEELCEMVLYLPASDIKATFSVLDKLDAFTEENIAFNLFYSMQPKFYPIFAPLKDSSAHHIIARRAYQAFVNMKTDWLMEAILPILDLAKIQHRKFLFEYLHHGDQGEPTSRMKNIGGQVITEVLPELSEDKRRDLAIVRTIRALPLLKGKNIRQVLENISSKRYLLVIPDWPPNCRKAAKEALADLDKQHLSLR